MTSAPTITFRPRPSRILLCATCGIAVLALVALALTGAPRWVHVILLLVLVLDVVLAMRSMVRSPIESLAWRADGGADLVLRDHALEAGREVLGAVSAARVLGPLIVLKVRWPPRERAHLWLLPDNLDAATRRQLRMRIGHGDGLSVNADSA